MRSQLTSPREHLVRHVQMLERLTTAKQEAGERLKEAFHEAQQEGFDPVTLKVVLKLRKMTPNQRRERRALEAIYLSALGMLDGDALPESARRRLDGRDSQKPPAPPTPSADAADGAAPASTPDEGPAPPLEQPALALKDPEEARREGADAAAAGQRIYDNPYPAGDPCRAAWDEGWCTQRKSHGMDLPAAYQRRGDKPAKKGDDDQTAPAADEKGAA